jgi:hypothetical protein
LRKARAVFRSYDVSRKELSYNPDHPLIHDQISYDQQWQRHQKSDVNFDVKQKRHRHAAQGMTRCEREQEQGEPTQQRDDHYSSAH